MREPQSLRRSCAVLGLAASTWYYRPRAQDETAVRAAVQEVAAEYPTYGTRRIAAQLRRAPYRLAVGRKRVRRLMTEAGLLRVPRRSGRRTTQSQHAFPRYPNLVRGLEITRPDQVWVADVTYIRLRQEFVYLAILLDVFTRALRGWELSRSLGVDGTLPALHRALAQRTPQIHHSDQGVQYAATAYTQTLLQHHVQISMAAIGRADQNGYAERLIRTIKEEAVELSDYCDFHDASAHLGPFLDDVYQRKRIHSSLGYLTPLEFELHWAEAGDDIRLLYR